MTHSYLKRVLLALDYLLNALLFLGWHDEWISSRAWRMQHESSAWMLARRAIDAVASALGQQQHCYWSAVSANLYRSIPPDQRR
jgi:hypothetical protein